MKVRIEVIGKERATELLKSNTNNFRKLDSRMVQKYAREMKAGLWENNGEPIQIYTDGTLANGQHRLNAVILADVNIQFVVIYDIDKNVSIFDTQKKRTVVQIARQRGYKLSTQKAGAVGMLLFGLNDRSHRCGENEILEYYETHPWIDTVEKTICHGANTPILRKSPCVAAGYCAFVLGKMDLSQLDNFAKICNSGLPIDGIQSNAPLCLRKSMMEGFKDSTGKVITWGTQTNGLYFDICYRAMLDFAKGATPYRAYKPKMKKEEIDKILFIAKEK